MRHTLAFGIGSAAIALCSLTWFAACSSDDDAPAPAPSPDASAGDALALFRAMEADLVATCGGTEGACHVKGNTGAQKWLGEGDPYPTITGYRGVLPSSGDEANSILLTQIAHRGPSLAATPKLRADVLTWTTAELAARGVGRLPATEAIAVVSGATSVSLAAAATGIDGARVAFSVQSDGSLLSLSGITVFAPPDADLVLEHPYFVLVPEAGKVVEDPATNGFAGMMTVPAGGSSLLFAGQLDILGSTRNAKLRIYFKSLSRGAARTGPAYACNALGVFNQRAAAVFQQTVPLLEGGTATCYECHSGGNDSARAAFDLSALTTDNAEACAQAKRHINFTDKTMSRIVQNPQGIGNVTHPVGSLAASDPVVVGIKAWVDAEAP